MHNNAIVSVCSKQVERVFEAGFPAERLGAILVVLSIPQIAFHIGKFSFKKESLLRAEHKTY